MPTTTASDEPDYKALFGVLIRSLAAFEYWISVTDLESGAINLTLMENSGGQVSGKQLHTLAGTPEQCVAALAAIEAEKRLAA